MKNILAVILGIFSFLCLFVCGNHIVVILDGIFNLWGSVLLVFYLAVNYCAYHFPSYATSLFQNNRWPLLVLYAFIAIFVSVFIGVDINEYGFSIVPILHYGMPVILSALSFVKCISLGSSHAMDLRVLQFRSSAEGWSAEEFFLAKSKLDAARRKCTFVGLAFYGAIFVFTALILLLEWIFIYK